MTQSLQDCSVAYLADRFLQSVRQHVSDGGFGLGGGLGSLELVRVRAPVGVHVLLQEHGRHLAERGRTVRLKGQLSQEDPVV